MSRLNGPFLFLLTVLAVLGVLIPGHASAEESSWYAIARLGTTDSEVQFGSVHPKSIDDTGTGGAVELGYVLNRHLSVRAGYHDLGEHEGFGSPCSEEDEVCIERLATLGLCIEGSECTEVLTPLTADTSGFSLALVPTWQVSDRFGVYGKVGVFLWDSSISAESFGHIESFSGDDLIAGAGVRYDFRDGLGLLVEHEEIDLDAESTSLGLVWRF